MKIHEAMAGDHINKVIEKMYQLSYEENTRIVCEFNGTVLVMDVPGAKSKVHTHYDRETRQQT